MTTPLVKIATMAQALKWGERWEEAYLRLGEAYDHLRFHYEVRGDLLEHYEKLLNEVLKEEETVV